MTREDFDLLVRRIEQRYAGRPRSLRLAVVFWALVGYAWFMGWFLLVFLVAGALVAAGVAAGPDGVMFHVLAGVELVGGVFLVWRIVRVKLPPMEGRRITGREAPELFDALAGLRAKLRSIPFHRVLVVTELNASVIQQPRWGIFGWWRNYLLLGLPLLEVLSGEEFIAILAHEFAHLSRQHGRMTHWLYRLRKAWERIFAGLQQQGFHRRAISLRSLSAWFARWFWPRFNAHAFVLSRANEYEADRVAADLAGAPSIMSALSRLAANREFLDEKFWPGVRSLATGTPEPPADLISHFRAQLNSGQSPGELEENWRKELRGVTTNSDTHPSLNDRLQALGWNGANLLLPLRSPTAAEVLLAGALASVRADMNAIWRKELAKTWSDHNARAAVLRRRLGTLSTGTHASDADTLWDQACIRMELEKPSQVEPLLREILQCRPAHTGALIALGSSLLDRNDPEGVEYLERAIAGEEECVPHACELLQNYFRRVGDTEGMRKIRLRMDRYEQTLAASNTERNTVSARDTCIPHNLTPGELDTLRAALREFPEIHAAYLGRKELKHFAKQRFFLLCISLKSSWLGRVDREKERAIISKLALSSILPGRVFVFAPRGSFSNLARKLTRVPGTRVDFSPRK